MHVLAQQVLPCDAVNPIVSGLTWPTPQNPVGNTGAYWRSGEQKLSVGSENWVMEFQRSQWKLNCDGKCHMLKTSACARRSTSNGAMQCCTDNKVLDKKALQLSLAGLAAFKMGGEWVESVSPEGVSKASGGWKWSNLSFLVPEIVGTHTKVVGEAGLAFVADLLKEPKVMEDAKMNGCVRDGFKTQLGTTNYMKAPPGFGGDDYGLLDSFRANSVSTTTTPNGAVDVWVADLPYCLLAERGLRADSTTCARICKDKARKRLCESDCVKGLTDKKCSTMCGGTTDTSRILHVNALSGKGTTVLNSTEGILLDVAAYSDSQKQEVRLVTLHLNRTEARSVYTGGPWERMAPHLTGIKILTPAKECRTTKECPAKCTEFKNGGLAPSGWVTPGSETAKYLVFNPYGGARACKAEDANGGPRQSDMDKGTCKMKPQDINKYSWKSGGGWGSYADFNRMRSMTNMTTGDITNKGGCKDDLACAGCFRSCPDYILQFRTATKAGGGGYKLKSGEITKTIPASCVVPSIAADGSKVFVLTSSELVIYSHAGGKLTSWSNQKLQWGGWPAQGNSAAMWYLAAPVLACDHPKYSPSSDPGHGSQAMWVDMQARGRMGGQLALNTDSRHAILPCQFCRA